MRNFVPNFQNILNFMPKVSLPHEIALSIQFHRKVKAGHDFEKSIILSKIIGKSTVAYLCHMELFN